VQYKNKIYVNMNNRQLPLSVILHKTVFFTVKHLRNRQNKPVDE